jgi:hypothetical protein
MVSHNRPNTMTSTYSCPRIPLLPPTHACTCASHCYCPCHGKSKSRAFKTVPYDPDDFKTTYRGFYTPYDIDGQPRGRDYRPDDNLGLDPNVLPLNTEFQREYTPKKAEHEPPAKPRDWARGVPFDNSTIYKEHYVPPGPDDYPERARDFQKPLPKEPGTYDTTYKETYVRPDPDLYTSTAGPGELVRREGPPGIFTTEYKTNYLDHPRDRAFPFRSKLQPPGPRPGDYRTTHGGAYKAPGADDYPERDRRFQKALDTGPLGRKTSTHGEDYKDPGPPEDPLTTGRPRASQIIVGPTAPFESTSHCAHCHKDHFCCACAAF